MHVRPKDYIEIMRKKADFVVLDADIFSGYMIYAPATFIIKGFMALFAFYGFKLLHTKADELLSRVISGIGAEVVMILGYFLFEGFLYGFVPSLANIPANGIQGIAGLSIGVMLIKILLMHIVIWRKYLQHLRVLHQAMRKWMIML